MIDYKIVAKRRAIEKEIRRLKILRNNYKCSEADIAYIDKTIFKLEEELKGLKYER